MVQRGATLHDERPGRESPNRHNQDLNLVGPLARQHHAGSLRYNLFIDGINPAAYALLLGFLYRPSNGVQSRTILVVDFVEGRLQASPFMSRRGLGIHRRLHALLHIL